jgi:hypothetical protein
MKRDIIVMILTVLIGFLFIAGRNKDWFAFGVSLVALGGWMILYFEERKKIKIKEAEQMKIEKV